MVFHPMFFSNTTPFRQYNQCHANTVYLKLLQSNPDEICKEAQLY